MKRITECLNPGNGLNCLGVTNRYTPIDNIITNVRNYFGSLLGLVIQKAEDGISLKITSSSFADKYVTQNIMYNSSFDGHTKLFDYIASQGLDCMKIIEIGGYCIVYCSPSNVCTKDITKPIEDMKKSGVHEAEMTSVAPIVLEEYEEELEDTTKKDLSDIINLDNKVEAAEKFNNIISKKIELPENVYIKATKDVDGHESIALRYKYEKARPFSGKIPVSVSLLNIYSTGSNGVWAGIYDEYENKYGEEIENIVEQILKLIGATSTKDKKVWNIDLDDNNTSTKISAKADKDEDSDDDEDETDEDKDITDNNDKFGNEKETDDNGGNF